MKSTPLLSCPGSEIDGFFFLISPRFLHPSCHPPALSLVKHHFRPEDAGSWIPVWILNHSFISHYIIYIFKHVVLIKRAMVFHI